MFQDNRCTLIHSPPCQKFSLHSGMFIPTLKNQTTDEQKKLFLEPALKHQIIGCYAQTEVCWKIGLDGVETFGVTQLS